VYLVSNQNINRPTQISKVTRKTEQQLTINVYNSVYTKNPIVDLNFSGKLRGKLPEIGQNQWVTGARWLGPHLVPGNISASAQKGNGHGKTTVLRSEIAV